MLKGIFWPKIYWFRFILSALNICGFKPSGIYPCMFFGRGVLILVSIDYCLFFGTKLKDIYKVIQELKDDKLNLTIEDNKGSIPRFPLFLRVLISVHHKVVRQFIQPIFQQI